MALLDGQADIGHNEQLGPGTGQIVDVVRGLLARGNAEGFDVDLPEGGVFGPFLQRQDDLARIFAHQLLHLR